MKNLFLSAICLFVLNNGHAQLRIAPELGINVSTMSLKLINDPSGAYPHPHNSFLQEGLRAGAALELGLSKKIYLQTGGFYAMTGTSARVYYDGVGSVAVNIRVNTIEIPANIVYKFGTPGGDRFFIGAGPYLGYNISGTAKGQGPGSENLKIGSNTHDDIKAIDLGIGLRAGYELANGLFLGARYQQGLTDLCPSVDVNRTLFSSLNVRSARTSSFGIHIGYFLGRHTKK